MFKQYTGKRIPNHLLCKSFPQKLHRWTLICLHKHHSHYQPNNISNTTVKKFSPINGKRIYLAANSSPAAFCFKFCDSGLSLLTTCKLYCGKNRVSCNIANAFAMSKPDLKIFHNENPILLAARRQFSQALRAWPPCVVYWGDRHHLSPHT